MRLATEGDHADEKLVGAGTEGYQVDIAKDREHVGRAPLLGVQTRDRRWDMTRSFMREHGLSALIVCGCRGRESYETYLSGESVQGVVVFFVESPPIYLTWSAFRILGRSDPDNERRYWIDDIRAGLLGPGIVAALTERHLGGNRIGVVGVESRNPMELEGCVPYRVWKYVEDAFPDVEFVEVSDTYSIVMMQKGSDELEVARYCAEVGENACRRMLAVVREGVAECDVYAEIMSVIARSGLTAVAPGLIVQSGKEKLSWGPPEWGVATTRPRQLRRGDVVYAELMPSFGGIETQQQMTVVIGPIPPALADLGSVARAAYVAGLDAMRPGTTFSQVCDAMRAPLRDAGCWHLSPLVHSVSPATLIGSLYGDAEEALPSAGSTVAEIPITMDTELRAGMLFSLEPNACRGRQRVNIGGTAIVSDGGGEALNSVCCGILNVEG